MKRIAIVGSSGSGKSTLAVELGRRLGLEVHHLDAMLWQPGWVMIGREEEHRIQREMAARESWIIDGNYGGTMEIRFARADTIILLEFPRLLCLWRVVKRWLNWRGRPRADMGAGCPEKLDQEFIEWVWNFPRDCLPGARERVEAHREGRTVHILRGPREVRRFLAAIRACGHADISGLT